MICPHCRTVNPEGAVRCSKCNSSWDSDQPTLYEGSQSVARSPAPVSAIRSTSGGPRTPSVEWHTFEPGDVLAERYEIQSLLGEGGMGAVYKAVDRELDRVVAIKVIRPELASKKDILERFKQELIVARQITHRNVIRIFDLGVTEGLKFITMEFVEGRDLKHLVDEKKLTYHEAADIIRQVCLGLEAAHLEKVVHRDLKPQNIMIEPQGRVAVMDFGLAHVMDQQGMTRAGAILGTPDYMSPEQALAQKIDQRSDIFAVGLIFYEMLTGQVPFRTDTVVGTLVARTRERAAPPVTVDPNIPQGLSDVIVKCLAPDPEQRYQSTREVVEDLAAWAPSGASGSQPSLARSGLAPPSLGSPSIAPSSIGAMSRPAASVALPMAAPPTEALVAPPKSRTGLWIGCGAAVVALALAGYVFRDRFQAPRPGGQKPVRILIADFDNKSGEPVFDRTLEPMFSVALEGAPFITSVNRDQARKLGQGVQPNATRLDESLARLVAVREGYDVIFAGSIDKQGKGYALNTKAIDAVTGHLLAENRAESATRDAVLASVAKLAAPVRRILGDSTPESVQLSAGETFTASSIEAAHSYAVAQEKQYAGNFEEALRNYTQAIQLDPGFGRAYAGLAVIHRNLGHPQDAEKYFQMAMERIDRMTEREKLRTRGSYYVTNGQFAKAVEEFAALVERYPADTAGHANLAVSYGALRNFSKALQEGRAAVELNPKNVAQRNNLALFGLAAGDLETAMREAREALKLNPNYGKAFLAMALAQLVSGQDAQAAETYKRLQGTGTWGISTAAIGLGDLALSQGRAADAISLLEKGAAGDAANGNLGGAAAKWILLATARLAVDQKEKAVEAIDQAVGNSKDANLLLLGAHLYLEAGLEPKAQALAARIEQQSELAGQARARIARGELLLARKDPKAAAPLFEESLKQVDSWFGHFNLGRAYLAGGEFAKAATEFEICLGRRGEAAFLIIEDVPTYSYFPPVYYYLGRAQEGAANPSARESYRKFLSMQGQMPGPLVDDARKRTQ